jgi:hypothetical protein
MEETSSPEAIRKLIVDADNARDHMAKLVENSLVTAEMNKALHLSYLPELALSDFYLFGHVK